MTFLHPEFIYLMLPVLLILFGLLLTQGDAQELFFAPEALAKLRVETDQLSVKVRNIFYFLMFVFIILALADPVLERGSAKVKVKDDLFFIALDMSDSMLCEDLYPNRLEWGKKKIFELLAQKQNSRIGLMVFAESSYLVAPPTFDHKMLTFLLKPMNTSYTSEHSTNMLRLLQAVAKVLEEHTHKKLLIVTDGGEKRAFSEEIAYAKKEGIEVYILSVGTERGGVIEHDGRPLRYQGEVVVSRVNRAIEALAIESGGGMLEASDFSPFLESMNASSLQEDKKPIYLHLFIVPIALAMLMLLIATSSFHRGEKYYLPLVVGVLLMGVYPSSVRAGLFEYKQLASASKAYSEENFRISAEKYEEYALKYESIEAVYNAANGYYKMGKYKRAAGLYASIYFIGAKQNHQLFHNLGNTFAKMGRYEDLKKAIGAYEKALTFKEDRESRENLEAVRKAVEKSEAAIKNAYEKQMNRVPQKTKMSVATETNSQKSDAQQVENVLQQRAQMSDREAAKWLKVVEKHQYGQGYKIETPNAKKGVNSEKPW